MKMMSNQKMMKNMETNGKTNNPIEREAYKIASAYKAKEINENEEEKEKKADEIVNTSYGSYWSGDDVEVEEKKKQLLKSYILENYFVKGNARDDPNEVFDSFQSLTNGLLGGENGTRPSRLPEGYNKTYVTCTDEGALSIFGSNDGWDTHKALFTCTYDKNFAGADPVDTTSATSVETSGSSGHSIGGRSQASQSGNPPRRTRTSTSPTTRPFSSTPLGFALIVFFGAVTVVGLSGTLYFFFCLNKKEQFVCKESLTRCRNFFLCRRKKNRSANGSDTDTTTESESDKEDKDKKAPSETTSETTTTTSTESTTTTTTTTTEEEQKKK